MKIVLIAGLGLALLGGIAIGFGQLGGSQPADLDRTSSDAATLERETPNAVGCPIKPGVAEPDASRFLGGPSAGPVTFAIGDMPLYARPTDDGEDYFAKALLLLKAAPDDQVRLRGDGRNGGVMFFTHFEGNLEHFHSSGSVPDRGQGINGVADVPGYVVVDQPDCYLVEVWVGEDRYSLQFPVKVL